MAARNNTPRRANFFSTSHNGKLQHSKRKTLVSFENIVGQSPTKSSILLLYQSKSNIQTGHDRRETSTIKQFWWIPIYHNCGHFPFALTLLTRAVTTIHTLGPKSETEESVYRSSPQQNLEPSRGENDITFFWTGTSHFGRVRVFCEP